MFDESDQSRLLHLNKEINRLGLEVSERQLSLEQVRAVKDGQTALLHNCYLKKQTQLEDQRAEQEMEAHLNKGKSVDYNAAIEEQEQVKRQLHDLQEQLSEKQALLDQALAKDAAAGAGQASASGLGEEELEALRQRTREVEQIGTRIDDVIKQCQDQEAIISKLGRFDEGVFAETKDRALSDAQLKKLVHEMTQKLDKFPRKNRHSQEWYERYLQKFQELKQ